ncbi:hypothetical protein QQX98_002686 [Neonectria punicea]|uniref:Toxin subunit n=1 Tax=Neonectria punicea TaxID=979145 RepID=A0ABR1HH24_9HYPO
MFPLKFFPYSQALEDIDIYLSALSLIPSDIFATFRSEAQVVAQFPDVILQDRQTRKAVLNDASTVCNRAFVAERLGLKPLDYAAITRELIYPTDFLDLLSGLSSGESGLPVVDAQNREAPATHRNWGYADKAFASSENSSCLGQGCPSMNFLTSAGRDIFGRRLVITNANRIPEFTEHLSDMRLLSLDMSSDAETPPVGPLTEDICHELQGFIWLRSRLGWSISQLDSVLSGLTENQMMNGMVYNPLQPSHAITSLMLEDVSYVVRLNNLTRLPVDVISSLWAPLNAHGRDSLYGKLFLGPAVRLGDADTFKPNAASRYFEGSDETLGNHLPVLMAAFRLNLEDLNTFMTVAGVKGDQRLTLDRLSQIYRHTVLCKILGGQPKEYDSVRGLVSGGRDIFQDPKTTFTSVEAWRKLIDSGWSVAELLSLTARSPSEGAAVKLRAEEKSGVDFVHAVAEKIDAFQQTWRPKIDNNIASAQDVLDICIQLYDGHTAQLVASFVEGQCVTSELIDINAGELLPDKSKLPAKLSVLRHVTGRQNQLTLNVRGILSDEELKVVKNVSQKDGSFISGVERVHRASKVALQALVSRLYARLSPEEQESATKLFLRDIQHVTETKPPNSAEETEIQKVTALTERFARLALPTLTAQVIRDSSLQAVVDKVPGLDHTILNLLLDGGVAEASSERKVADSPLQRLETVAYLSDNVKELKAAYFTPTATDVYTFQHPNSRAAVQFSINGVSIPHSGEAMGQQSDPVALSTGETYLLTSSTNIADLTWSTKQSVSMKFANSTLLSQDSVKTIDSILIDIVRTAQLVQKQGLTLEEFKYFTKPDSFLPLNLDAVSLSTLSALETYKDLRNSLGGGKDSLIHLFGWLTNPVKPEELAPRLAAATGWREEQLTCVLEMKFIAMDPTEIVQEFRNINSLLVIQKIIKVMQRVKPAPGRDLTDPIELMFKVAVPTSPSRVEDDFQNASLFQVCLTERQLAQCTTETREKHRDALVQYLLQQPFIRNERKIYDADGLFDYFLMDVQMGAKLETTRMKQAISVVQLYVQRCLLGLEADEGVNSSDILADKWAWMQKHSVWQATRKAFLYPENWIDPSLRDDKTALFVEYEANIMQKDLNWETFAGAIKGYVQGLSEISDLDILAYIREKEDGVDLYHFFGRTRNAPYSFYHCRMRLVVKQGHVFWSPWIKMELEATTYETDWNGDSLSMGGNYVLPVLRGKRLYLYLPQIMSKAISPDAPRTRTNETTTTPTTFSEMEKRSVGTMVSPKTWDIRMAWTELVDGKWLPKRVSNSSFIVDWSPANVNEPLPSIANFIFSTKTDGNDVNIHVGCWRDEGRDVFSLEQFVIADDRVIAVKSSQEKIPNVQTIPTTFHKYSWEDSGTSKVVEAPVVKAYANGTESLPLLALPPRETGTKRNLCWTMSYGENIRNVTGLVVDEKTNSTPGRSVFMYPLKQELDRTVTSVSYSDTVTVSSNEVIEHGAAQQLMQSICEPDSIDSLFKTIRASSDMDYGNTTHANATGMYHELRTSYALYNWELGLHTVLMAMDRFHATQQFETALRVARIVFDPTVNPPAEHAAPWTACWKFPPFAEIAKDRVSIADAEFEGWPSDHVFEMAVSERRSNPSNAHATARGRPKAYMKWIVMKYIEILIAAGDEFFRQGSLESLPLAIQRYIEATHILGPEPPKMPRLGKAVTRSFRTLGSQTSVNLELAFPFMCDVERRGNLNAKDNDTTKQSLLCILQTSYFCLPPNPKYQALRTLVGDRLFKSPSWTLPPSPTPCKEVTGISSLLNDLDSPMPFYRFSSLISKALEICAELRNLSEQFLQAKEKQDAEAFVLLKTRQESMKQILALDIKQLQRQEIEKTIESLLINRATMASKLSFYLQLLGEPLGHIPDETTEWEDIKQTIDHPTTDDLRMNYHEAREMLMSDVSTGLNVGASALDIYTSFLRSLPCVTSNFEPWGVGVSVRYDSHLMAETIHGSATAVRMLAMIASEDAHKSAGKASLTRQLQERRMQANVKGREMKSLDKQIEIQKKRLEINSRETALQKQEIEFVAETEKWYMSKYTNANLYSWMENSVRSIQYDLYLLTADLARRAEKAFRFERGANMPLSFLRTGGYWDSSRDGLMAAQQLSFDLRRMETAYLEKLPHDFEISKNISLRQLDPLALIDLRETGTAVFAVPELMFDVDFPGHYMRRIRSVALSIPCLVGPYTSIAATLSLVEHKYRVSAVAAKGEHYHDLTGSNANTDQFRADRVPITQVAISSGVQDAGLFELGPRDGERFQPFEGAGAISTWRLTLPTTVRQFDHQTISDVVLHMRYTAVDGGPLLRRAANEAVTAYRSTVEELGNREGLFAYFDLKNDFSNQWYAFQAALSGKGAAQTKREATLDLSGLPDRLPFWARDKEITVLSLTIVVNGKDDTIENDLVIGELGDGKWDPVPVGGSKLLTRGSLKQSLAGWKLVVSKDSGSVSDIQGMCLVFRYALSDKE